MVLAVSPVERNDRDERCWGKNLVFELKMNETEQLYFGINRE